MKKEKQIKKTKPIQKTKQVQRTKMIRKRKEKYFICPYCADLKTDISRLADCEMGGPGMCDCQFTTLFWNSNCQDLDTDTPRIYHEYVEISKDWFDCLGDIFNDVLRRDAFKEIPGIMRLK